MKKFFICYNPRTRTLTFLKTDRLMGAAEVRSMMLGTTERVSPAALQVWGMNESRYNYIKGILLEEGCHTSVCV